MGRIFPNVGANVDSERGRDCDVADRKETQEEAPFKGRRPTNVVRRDESLVARH